MLTTSSSPNGQPLNLLTGAAFRRMLHGKSISERSEIAAQLIKHKATFTDLSAAQVARLVGATDAGVCIALGHVGSRGPQRRTVNHLIKRYGPDTLLKVVDCYTAPTMQAAE